jgi:hypothetical protein
MPAHSCGVVTSGSDDIRAVTCPGRIVALGRYALRGPLGGSLSRNGVRVPEGDFGAGMRRTGSVMLLGNPKQCAVRGDLSVRNLGIPHFPQGTSGPELFPSALSSGYNAWRSLTPPTKPEEPQGWKASPALPL